MKVEPRRILVGEPSPTLANHLVSVLESYDFRVSLVGSGKELINRGFSEDADLVIVDIALPEPDGLSVVKVLKARNDLSFLPVLMIVEDEVEMIRAFASGADDVLIRPFSQMALIARVRSQLRLKEYFESLGNPLEILERVARYAEARIRPAESHIERMIRYARWIADELGLSDEEKRLLEKGCRLHDIGLTGVQDSLLLKPGPLTKEEQQAVRRHIQIAEEILSPIPALRPVLPLIRHHHERWDGKGYPDGLKGEEIPLLARIVAVVDAFDSMMSDRPFRPRMNLREAAEQLEALAGQQFDPGVVEALLRRLAREGML